MGNNISSPVVFQAMENALNESSMEQPPSGNDEDMEVEYICTKLPAPSVDTISSSQSTPYIGGTPKATALEQLTTFTNFPKLPSEIQIKIWKEAIPAPRVMKLKTHIHHWLMQDYDRNNNWGDDYDFSLDQQAALKGLDFSTDTKPSGMLGACKVARAEFLRVHCSVIKGRRGKIFRFDGQNDTILFHANEYHDVATPLLGYPGKRLVPPAQRRLRDYSSLFVDVKNLAWSRSALRCSRTPGGDIVWLILQFKSLETLTLVDGYLPEPSGPLSNRRISRQWRDYWIDYNNCLKHFGISSLATDYTLNPAAQHLLGSLKVNLKAMFKKPELRDWDALEIRIATPVWKPKDCTYVN